jgi:ParB family chromosome partitioning protein
MAQQKIALGKGLASLLPGAAFAQPQESGALPPLRPPQASPGGEMSNKDRHPGITFASLEEISVNPYQPRREFNEVAIQELAESIKANGLIQPLIVRKGSSGFELIAGERRMRASKLAGLTHVPVVIRKSTDRESLEIALVENIQRKDLNCVDEALAYQQLVQDFSLTQDEVAKRVGKDRATVANCLRLLKLQEPILAALKSETISLGHAKVLLGVDDLSIRLQLLQSIIQKQLSVRDTENSIQEMSKQKQEGTAPSVGDAPQATTPAKERLRNLSLDLTRQLGARTEFRGSERRGKIILHYTNRQDLEKIISVLRGE